MTVDVTQAFFDELGRRGREPLLGKATGTVRFDLTDGKRTERWLVTVKMGDVAVSRKNVAADCVVTADRAVFEGVTGGRTNAFAALLRGAMSVEGDAKLLVAFQRLLPGPRRARQRRRADSERSTR